jgi:hypothetical protein
MDGYRMLADKTQPGCVTKGTTRSAARVTQRDELPRMHRQAGREDVGICCARVRSSSNKTVLR